MTRIMTVAEIAERWQCAPNSVSTVPQSVQIVLGSFTSPSLVTLT